ncbi:hypothetical protein DENSPDRAFT_859988 [Dentipellis sp. KUC8613]|nr:hypothetical protein DENSPDRAFT_859988 [Dentipellis sp. KUC8613]
MPDNKPAWQTDELQDEWPDDDDEPTTSSNGSRSVSLTVPIGSIRVRSESEEPTRDEQRPAEDTDAGGTFLIRQDAPAAVLPKTPGQRKGAGRDFFSPLPLERMFEPPSPPHNPSAAPIPINPAAPPVPSRLSQVHVASSFSTDDGEVVRINESDEIIETDLPNMTAFDGRRPSINCQFTFNVPRHSPSNAITPSGTTYPQAQSTPGPSRPPIPSAPPTDPRLRLFQFQYDTFTRDHLSAMVDSIAVNSPSGSNTGNLTGNISSPFGLSPVSEATAANNTSDLRSAKRVKLSPVSDYYGEGAGAGAAIQRPPVRKDYVGESKSLMAQIKLARDYSTISTVATAQSPAGVNHTPGHDPGHPPEQGSSGSKRESYSSLGYRQQAANLMAQIKNDMKGSKRLWSVDTDVSQTSRGDFAEEPSLTRQDGRSFNAQDRGSRRLHPPSPARTVSKSSSTTRGRHQSSPRRVFRRPSASDQVPRAPAAQDSGSSPDTSMTTSQLYAQFPAPPIVIAQAPSPQRTASPVSQPNPRGLAGNPNPTSNPNAALLSAPGGAAPAYPSSSIRARTNEDLNRFVSSSTASGTTLTAGSTASFVKHPGPAQITRIAPEDVGTLPDRVGRMVFDKVMMRWVKSTAEATRLVGPASDGYAASVEGDSEDPFRDIESIRDEDSGERDTEDTDLDGLGGVHHLNAPLEMSRIEEVEDEEEVELTSFSFDGPPHHVVQVLGNDEDIIIDDDETTDTEDQDDVGTAQMAVLSLAANAGQFSGSDDDDDADVDATEQPHYSLEPAFTTPNPPAAFSTPLPHRAAAAAPTPIRSVLKSTSVTPVSALKNGSVGRHQTPARRRGHRRSVSFSDGKREGQIRGLGRDGEEADDDAVSDESEDEAMAAGASSMVPSARSKRIADMMHDLEDTSLDENSPSKAGSSGRLTEPLQPLSARRPAELTGGIPPGDVSRRVFSRGRTGAGSVAAAGGSFSGKANATFLTEASFGVAHDKLVQVITDVQPFEPYWEDLSAIDLSRKHIESVARLKEFLPKIDSLSLNHNQISWLSGVPTTVRTLSIAYNQLTRVTSFNHLLSLESLDVSHNDIDSLNQLECLRHLRELRADTNRIRSIEGLQGMTGLVKLSLQGNCIDDVDLDQCSWSKLEVLNLSHNRIERVAGLASLSCLIVLNLDNNQIGELDAHGVLARLRILRLSANRVKALNVAPFPNLRTLYADNNALGQITKANRLSKLENLSLRNQGGKGLLLSIRDVRDVKRLYLSGNPLPADFISEACYNLIYLELAACRLTRLPEKMAGLVPNLRVLNLNYNFLDEVKALEGLRRLNKLTIIGSRLKGTKGVLKVLKGCPDVEMVDFRMNPCTLGWYLPLLVKDVPGALQPSEPGQRLATEEGRGYAPAPGSAPDSRCSGRDGSGDPHARRPGSSVAGAGAGAGSVSWQELDAKFRRDLPDEAYVGRLAYRGLVMRACRRVKMVDGVVVTRKERDKAERFLEGVGRAQGGRVR